MEWLAIELSKSRNASAASGELFYKNMVKTIVKNVINMYTIMGAGWSISAMIGDNIQATRANNLHRPKTRPMTTEGK